MSSAERRWPRAQIHPASRQTRFVCTQLKRYAGMPVAVPWALTAGSLGDIQGVVTLLCKLGQVIYNGDGASSEYKELKEEISTFIEMVFEVENLFAEVWKIQASSSLHHSVLSLSSKIARCRVDIEDFFKEYHIQDRWNKIKWVLWGHTARTALRERDFCCIDRKFKRS
jgi:hypothetical protein